jgi:hypothetical protein
MSQSLKSRNLSLMNPTPMNRSLKSLSRNRLSLSLSLMSQSLKSRNLSLMSQILMNLSLTNQSRNPMSRRRTPQKRLRHSQDLPYKRKEKRKRGLRGQGKIVNDETSLTPLLKRPELTPIVRGGELACV